MADYGMPAIRLEIERMKFNILHMLSQHAIEMDSMVKEAIERYCSEDNIRGIIHDQAAR